MRAIQTALADEQPRVAIREALQKALAADDGTRLIGVKKGPRNAKLHHILHPCGGCGLPVPTVVRGTNPAHRRLAACSMNNPVCQCAGVCGSALAHSCEVVQCASVPSAYIDARTHAHSCATQPSPQKQRQCAKASDAVELTSDD